MAQLNVAKMNLAPEFHDEALQFELAVLGLGPQPSEMPGSYTAALFDAYAQTFDDSLVRELEYRAPQHLMEALLAALLVREKLHDNHAAASTLAVCDIGCGTGLLAPLLRPRALTLAGVDRSPGMLEKARILGLYDDLTVGDLTDVLNSRVEAYDVVTAADVLVYIGDLVPALAAVATSLRPRGVLAFTVQSCEEEGAHLTSSGRYEHGDRYVREAAAHSGLIEMSFTPVTLRKEQCRPVAGSVWIFRKGTERGRS